MKTHTINKVLGVTAASICTIFAVGQPAQAFSFTGLNSEWHIVLDSFSDGRQGNNISIDSNYEMFGMAAKVENGQAYFAFHGNLGQQGRNGIGYGDLFFNFSGESFKDASATGKLFAVHFVLNDAGNGNLEYGLDRNVSAKSVTRWNSGNNGFLYYRTKSATMVEL